MLCTQLVGMHLDYRLRMQRSNEMQIRASGPMKILQFKKLQCEGMPAHLIGIELFTPVIPSITNGINGCFYRCTTRDWLIEKTLRLIGAQIARQF